MFEFPAKRNQSCPQVELEFVVDCPHEEEENEFGLEPVAVVVEG